jgi:hypothetical protein
VDHVGVTTVKDYNSDCQRLLLIQHLYKLSTYIHQIMYTYDIMKTMMKQFRGGIHKQSHSYGGGINTCYTTLMGMVSIGYHVSLLHTGTLLLDRPLLCFLWFVGFFRHRKGEDVCHLLLFVPNSSFIY